MAYQVVKFSLGRQLDWLRFRESAGNTQTETVAFDDERLRTIFTPAHRLEKLNSSREDISIGLEVTLNAMEAIERSCLELEARCVSLLIPTKESVYWPYAAKRLQGKGLDLVRRIVEQEAIVRQEMIAFLKGKNFAYLDLLPGMQAAAEDRILYLAGLDDHPNGTGYRAIAEIVWREIQSLER